MKLQFLESLIDPKYHHWIHHDVTSKRLIEMLADKQQLEKFIEENYEEVEKEQEEALAASQEFNFVSISKLELNVQEAQDHLKRFSLHKAFKVLVRKELRKNIVQLCDCLTKEIIELTDGIDDTDDIESSQYTTTNARHMKTFANRLYNVIMEGSQRKNNRETKKRIIETFKHGLGLCMSFNRFSVPFNVDVLGKQMAKRKGEYVGADSRYMENRPMSGKLKDMFLLLEKSGMCRIEYTDKNGAVVTLCGKFREYMEECRYFDINPVVDEELIILKKGKNKSEFQIDDTEVYSQYRSFKKALKSHNHLINKIRLKNAEDNIFFYKKGESLKIEVDNLDLNNETKIKFVNAATKTQELWSWSWPLEFKRMSPIDTLFVMRQFTEMSMLRQKKKDGRRIMTGEKPLGHRAHCIPLVICSGGIKTNFEGMMFLNGQHPSQTESGDAWIHMDIVPKKIQKMRDVLNGLR